MGLKDLLIDSEGGLQPNGTPFNQRSFGYGENAPLVVKDLPSVTESTNSNPRLNLINDVTGNFIRGGAQGVASRVKDDFKRLTKFAVTPQGIGFLASNVALQATNPKNLTSPRNRLFTGLGTLSSALTSFAGLRFRRDGLIDLSFESGYNYDPTRGGKKYENQLRKLARDNEEISTKKKLQNTTLLSIYDNLSTGKQNPDLIKKYIGGPHSTFGIGRTKIKRYKSNPYGNNPYISLTDPTFRDKNHPDGPSSLFELFRDFRRIKKNNPDGSPIPYTDGFKNSEYVYKTGTPGLFIHKTTPNERGINYGAYEVRTTDEVNMANIFKRVNLAEPKIFKDYIKFRIAVVNTENPLEDNVILFRAFLDNINDNYVGNWNSHQYNGRAEKFYTYDGFDRQIQFNFKIHAQTRHEQKPLWKKLNYLVAQTSPEYKNRRMRGVFTRLTMGDWINEVPGFFTNVNLTWNTSYPWEVRSDGQEGGVDEEMGEYPHVLDVSCTFQPIHAFAPSNSALTPFIIDENEQSFTEFETDGISSNEETATNRPEIVELPPQTTVDEIISEPTGPTIPGEFLPEGGDLELDEFDLDEDFEDFVDEELEADLEQFDQQQLNEQLDNLTTV